jgi:hypothetical protein
MRGIFGPAEKEYAKMTAAEKAEYEAGRHRMDSDDCASREESSGSHFWGYLLFALFMVACATYIIGSISALFRVWSLPGQ